MILITILALIFIVYEIFKFFTMETRWNKAVGGERNKYIILIESIYLIFTVGLLFTHYWLLGAGILGTSIITTFQLSDDFMDRKKFNKNIRHYYRVDSILCTLYLSLIVIIQLILFK